MSQDADGYYSLSDGPKGQSPEGHSAGDALIVSVQEKYQGGDSYDGTAVRRNGTTVKEGSGRYQFGNGSVYEGQWHRGAMHGRGVFYEAETGDRFEGQWSYGRRVRGVYYFPNGDLFIGAFDSETGNMKHGRCVLVDDLEPYDAEYDNDVLVWKAPLQTGARPGGLPAVGSTAPLPATQGSAGRQPSAQRLLNGDVQGDRPPMDQLEAAKVVLRSNRDRARGGGNSTGLRAFLSLQRGSFDRFAPEPRQDHVKEALRYFR